MSCPEPGIYNDVPFADYAVWDAMNASTLCHGLQSMRALRAALDGRIGSSDSAAMRFGRALHCRLLEPDKFATEWPVAKRCEQELSSGKNKGEPCGCNASYIGEDGRWYCGKHCGDVYKTPSDYITPEEAERIDAIRRNALGDKATGERGHEDVMWMAGRGHSEVSIVFDLYGVRCKARLDKWIPESSLIVDVKTISKPFNESTWLRTTLDLNYHVKAAWYVEAVKAHGFDSPGFAWVYVETSEPYDVAVVAMTPEVADAGRIEALQTLSSYRACLQSGSWPGRFPTMVSHLTFPAWKLNEYEGQEIE